MTITNKNEMQATEVKQETQATNPTKESSGGLVAGVLNMPSAAYGMAHKAVFGDSGETKQQAPENASDDNECHTTKAETVVATDDATMAELQIEENTANKKSATVVTDGKIISASESDSTNTKPIATVTRVTRADVQIATVDVDTAANRDSETIPEVAEGSPRSVTVEVEEVFQVRAKLDNTEDDNNTIVATSSGLEEMDTKSKVATVDEESELAENAESSYSVSDAQVEDGAVVAKAEFFEHSSDSAAPVHSSAPVDIEVQKGLVDAKTEIFANNKTESAEAVPFDEEEVNVDAGIVNENADLFENDNARNADLESKEIETLPVTDGVVDEKASMFENGDVQNAEAEIDTEVSVPIIKGAVDANAKAFDNEKVQNAEGIDTTTNVERGDVSLRKDLYEKIDTLKTEPVVAGAGDLKDQSGDVVMKTELYEHIESMAPAADVYEHTELEKETGDVISKAEQFEHIEATGPSAVSSKVDSDEIAAGDVSLRKDLYEHIDTQKESSMVAGSGDIDTQTGDVVAKTELYEHIESLAPVPDVYKHTELDKETGDVVTKAKQYEHLEESSPATVTSGAPEIDGDVVSKTELFEHRAAAEADSSNNETENAEIKRGSVSAAKDIFEQSNRQPIPDATSTPAQIALPTAAEVVETEADTDNAQITAEEKVTIVAAEIQQTVEVEKVEGAPSVGDISLPQTTVMTTQTIVDGVEANELQKSGKIVTAEAVQVNRLTGEVEAVAAVGVNPTA